MATLWCQGKRQREIAEELGVSLRTVEADCAANKQNWVDANTESLGQRQPGIDSRQIAAGFGSPNELAADACSGRKLGLGESCGFTISLQTVHARNLACTLLFGLTS